MDPDGATAELLARNLDPDRVRVAVEIGDWTRFDGNSIGAYLGLVPSEHSSGASKMRGGITRTGNSHVRRLLIEAAPHHMQPYRKGRVLRARWDLASPAARARGDAGNRRLYLRWQQFQARNKRHHVATVAIARELAGWCWSLAVIDDSTQACPGTGTSWWLRTGADPRTPYEQPSGVTLELRQRRTAPSRNTVMR